MALDLGHGLWPFAISAQVLEQWVQECLIGGSDFFFFWFILLSNVLDF